MKESEMNGRRTKGDLRKRGKDERDRFQRRKLETKRLLFGCLVGVERRWERGEAIRISMGIADAPLVLHGYIDIWSALLDAGYLLILISWWNCHVLQFAVNLRRSRPRFWVSSGVQEYLPTLS
jgi:hypothetical protein